MNLKTKLAAAMVLAASASMAQAASTTYSVDAMFQEPMAAYETYFDGTFTWDNVSNTVTAFTGAMNNSMYDAVQDMNLTYLLDQSVVGNTVKATVFLVNSTKTFADGTFNTIPQGNANEFKYIDPVTSVPNANAFFTLAFDKSTMAGLTTQMIYGDCTAEGLMMPMMTGPLCMTGYGTNMMTGGSMGGYTESLVITEVAAVPVPAAAWLFGGALLSLFGANRRKSVLPA